MAPTAIPDRARPTQPLTDAEFEELGRTLGADGTPDTALDLGQLDGFLAALICAPRVVLPSAYVPAIFGDEEVTWPDQQTAQCFFDLLMRRWNEIAVALMRCAPSSRSFPRRRNGTTPRPPRRTSATSWSPTP